MAVTVKDVKQYLRLELDFDDDDTFILGLITAAQKYIKDVTGKTFVESETTVIYLYDLVVTMLAGYWYLHRSPVSDKPVNDLPFTLNALINHLSLCGAYV